MPAPQVLYLVVDRPGLRLDKYLAEEYPDFSRSQLRKLIDEARVQVNQRTAKPSLTLKPGDHVTVDLPPPLPARPLPEDIPISVVYEDADIIVVDKPAGLTVHPAPGHRTHTLVNALLARYPELATLDESERPGIVHRLDRDTSGLMVVARNGAARDYLARQIGSHAAIKQYLTLVRGVVSPPQGVIEAPIGRSPRDRKKMAVTATGRPAMTVYRVVHHLDNHTLLEATLKTGRTHQIRVHMALMGYPVLGDPVYGVMSPHLKRQFLHSYCLGFRLPSTREYVEFKSELPADLQEALDKIAAGAPTSRS